MSMRYDKTYECRNPLHFSTVTSSEFSQQHHIISASDDRTVKVLLLLGVDFAA